MKNNINLIDYKKKVADKSHDKKQKPLKIIAFCLLIGVSIFSIVFFILIAISPLPSLRNQSKIAEATLSLNNNEIIKQEIIKERLGEIKEIIKNRSYFDKILEYLQNKLPSGVTIDTLTLDKKGMYITFSSKSLLHLDNLSKELISEESEKKFSKVTLVNLSMSEDENTFLLIISLNIV